MNYLLSFTCVDCLSWTRLSSLVNRVITGPLWTAVEAGQPGVSGHWTVNKYFPSVDWSVVKERRGYLTKCIEIISGH